LHDIVQIITTFLADSLIWILGSLLSGCVEPVFVMPAKAGIQ
jgi:hypothetical protein